MTKQELAQKRNYFKFVLTGMIKPIDHNSLSDLEISGLNSIKKEINLLLQEFDNTSKQLGLNVPNKCWCGKAVLKNKNHCGRHEEFEQ